MGRTIAGYERDKSHNFIGFKKGKKITSKRKNKNISKCGRSHTPQEEIQVDTFELQSPRDSKHTTDLQWE